MDSLRGKQTIASSCGSYREWTAITGLWIDDRGVKNSVDLALVVGRCAMEVVHPRWDQKRSR